MSQLYYRGFNLIVGDVENLHLEIEELKPPTLEEKGFDFTPGGGTGEITVPLGVTNKLEMPFKLATQNPKINALFGLPPGKRTPFTGRKSLFNDETGDNVEVTIDTLGRLMKLDPDAMKGGEKAGFDHLISAITWYQEVWDGTIMREFSFKKGGWTILNGSPANVAHRAALGI